jgi:signal transduction histidine kinase
MDNDASFTRLVSLAAHDLRTPLATISGFAKTLERTVRLESPADRYVEMIVAAADQLAELIDELSLAARIEDGRYEPNMQETDSLELAREAVTRLGADRVRLRGEGAPVYVERAATGRGVSALVQAALRHGGLDEVTVSVRGPELEIEPITDSSARVVLAEDLRDLGAAVAVRQLVALGASVAVEDAVLRIRLPR